jgi:hypothetical protein
MLVMLHKEKYPGLFSQCCGAGGVATFSWSRNFCAGYGYAYITANITQKNPLRVVRLVLKLLNVMKNVYLIRKYTYGSNDHMLELMRT